MSRRLRDAPDRAPVVLEHDGRALRAFEGESVAAALHAAGARIVVRSPKYHRPRGFFCLEGHCSGCLMRIGGVPNLRACMESCRDGLTVQGQNAYPSAEIDLLGAVDWLFPRGMDHHTLMTGSRLLNRMASKVVRQLSGLGVLPDRAPGPVAPATTRRPDVAVIGAGPAGLAAAAAAARAGASVLLVDEQPELGGSLLADPRHGRPAAARAIAAARAAGVEILGGFTAIGFFPEDDGGLLAIAGAAGLGRVQARRYLYATGGYAQNLPFADNDRPGVMAARAVGRLLVQHAVRPGDRICLVGHGDYPDALAAALTAAGSQVHALGADEKPIGVRGRSWVKRLIAARDDGGRRKIDCDLVAVWTAPAPASELPRQHGCEVTLRPAAGGFAVVTDDDGRTSVDGVFACGDVCGFSGPEAAALAGDRVGRAAAAAAAAPRASIAAAPSPAAAPPAAPVSDVAKTIACRCEDVTMADVAHACAAGYADIEEVKRYTGFGTGPCQGKECMAMIAGAIAGLTGQPPSTVPPFTARSPLAPTPLKLLATDPSAETGEPEP